MLQKLTAFFRKFHNNDISAKAQSEIQRVRARQERIDARIRFMEIEISLLAMEGVYGKRSGG